MKKVSIKQQLAIDYLRLHPELHTTGAKRLAVIVDSPKLSRMTWHRAKAVLGCPELPAGGQGSYGNAYYAQKVQTDDTVKIEVDKALMVIRFHRRSGLQVERSKKNREYLNASLQLFEHGGWIEVDNRGGVVTLIPK